MSERNEPIVGEWFRDLEGKSFEIVAIDEPGRTVEIQYFDGDVEALDFDDWYEVELEPIAAPEDWSGPYDNVGPDDFGDTDRIRRPEGWGDPLNELERKEH